MVMKRIAQLTAALICGLLTSIPAATAQKAILFSCKKGER